MLYISLSTFYRWNITNENGQIIVPFRFHHNYPRKWKQFVKNSFNDMTSYIRHCILFVDDTNDEFYNENFIEITCGHPETNAFNQGIDTNINQYFLSLLSCRRAISFIWQPFVLEFSKVLLTLVLSNSKQPCTQTSVNLHLPTLKNHILFPLHFTNF